jgi:hypothetical protein
MGAPTGLLGGSSCSLALGPLNCDSEIKSYSGKNKSVWSTMAVSAYEITRRAAAAIVVIRGPHWPTRRFCCCNAMCEIDG